jgi:phosphatidylglycerol:prolipoprotein diacylglycerol transferase
MIIHPNFDPVALHLFGGLAIRWYALSYIVGFVLFIWLGRYRIRQNNSILTRQSLDDLLTWGILGVILGGRLGYVLFYQREHYFAHPLDVFKVWEGGMSFHGGFLGVLIVVFLFAKRHKLSFLQLSDCIVPLVPTGLASGRIGNFINGELWGRITQPEHFWAMGFPQAQHIDQMLAINNTQYAQWLTQFGALPRNPSQLYQFALEGILLFIIVWLFSSKPRPVGQITSLFLAGYGFFRFIAEFAREPDSHLGLLNFGLSMGQWLSLPMMILGVFGFIYLAKSQSSQS